MSKGSELKWGNLGFTSIFQVALPGHCVSIATVNFLQNEVDDISAAPYPCFYQKQFYEYWKKRNTLLGMVLLKRHINN